VAATRSPEATQLANELKKHLGAKPLTPQKLASELVALDAPTDLLAALDDALSRAAAAREDDELDDTLWGLPPTEQELAVARGRAQASVNDALRTALSDALSREEVGRRLGISPQAVSKRLAGERLVALSRGREKRFPAWQLYEDGVLPGLAEVIEAYPGTPLSLTAWATTPSADLDGRTPAEMLTRRDGVQRVLDAARALTPAAW
jgi:hypothetical protein